MDTELWAVIGTTIATIVLLVPCVVYAWYVLDSWIGDDDSYSQVIASVETLDLGRRGNYLPPSLA
jgi:hypothetical protein